MQWSSSFRITCRARDTFKLYTRPGKLAHAQASAEIGVPIVKLDPIALV